MTDVKYVEIGAEDQGQRLDNFLIKTLKGVPKSHIYRIIRSGEIRINKKRVQVSTRLVCGDLMRLPPIRVSAEKEVYVGTRLAQLLRDSIIFEDERLLVLNKPAGIAVHGGSGLSLGVIEALRQSRSDLPYLELIHRLDRDTSGCLLLAKKRSTLRAIQALFEARTIQKTYWALLNGRWVGDKTCRVDVALQKNTLVSKERIVVVDPLGKPSQTDFKLLTNFEQHALVEASPKSGRTHQIRVHSAYLGHAIVGDLKYGRSDTSEHNAMIKNRLYLHAKSIQFSLNGEYHVFEASIDNVYQKTLNWLGKE